MAAQEEPVRITKALTLHRLQKPFTSAEVAKPVRGHERFCNLCEVSTFESLKAVIQHQKRIHKKQARFQRPNGALLRNKT